MVISYRQVVHILASHYLPQQKTLHQCKGAWQIQACTCKNQNTEISSKSLAGIYATLLDWKISRYVAHVLCKLRAVLCELLGHQPLDKHYKNGLKIIWMLMSLYNIPYGPVF